MAPKQGVGLAAAAAALLVCGCGDSESNRPLSFKPGVYQGEKSPALTEQQRRDLQERGNLQK